jgi:hypothetical protein
MFVGDLHCLHQGVYLHLEGALEDTQQRLCRAMEKRINLGFGLSRFLTKSLIS